MLSQNFEFLRARHPELAQLATFAERYTHSDPAGAAVKLRGFAELLTGTIYARSRLPQLPGADFATLLNAPAFQSTINIAIRNVLHGLRKEGNRAAHGGTLTPAQALDLLEDAWGLARWWAINTLGATLQSIPAFQPTAPEAVAPNTAPNPVEEQKLANEVAAQQTLQNQYQSLPQTPAQLAALFPTDEATANQLHLTEAETRRRLIDRDLARAGWHVGTAAVSVEYTLPNNNRADYVLWDDNGKPLAVIEAKRTAKDLTAGRAQAASYADALESKFAQRPVIFTTNGHDIEIWDSGQPPRPIFGFYSKPSLQYRIYQRTARQPLAPIPINPAITDRLYQVEAIRRVSERFTAGHRKALIVQATGTGKTRVAISLTDVLMRAGWVKRVLFLCDRTELRKQAKDNFRDYLKEPIAILESATQRERTARIYLATYPAIDGFFQSFDPGYFDLLIADESHRGIYNHYRDLFRYFDCLQLGLTATPVEFIARNSFEIFDCGNQDPTFNYDLDQAVAEHHLVPHEVITHTHRFPPRRHPLRPAHPRAARTDRRVR